MRKKVKQKKAKIKKKIELLFIIMFILAKQIWNVITIKTLTGRSDYVLSLLRDARRHNFPLATFIFSKINTKKLGFLKLK